MSERLHERVRELVREARAVAADPDSVRSVQSALLSGFIGAIEADPDVHRLFIATAANRFVRDVLKRFYEEHERTAAQARLAQLSLWPADARGIVEQIDKERVFVPSREQFVELVPDALTVAEIREAGQHLIQIGEDTMRRGRALLQLADMVAAA